MLEQSFSVCAFANSEYIFLTTDINEAASMINMLNEKCSLSNENVLICRYCVHTHVTASDQRIIKFNQYDE